MTLAMRDSPYQSDHAISVNRGMEQGKEPRSLAGLVRWFVNALSAELPDKLHKGELWHDQVSAHERENGITPQGGSQLGAPAYAGLFRVILEASPAMTDEDGYYLFPIRSSLSRLARRRPLTARVLMRVGIASGDWHAVSDDLHFEREMMELYLERALQVLWATTYYRDTRG